MHGYKQKYIYRHIQLHDSIPHLIGIKMEATFWILISNILLAVFDVQFYSYLLKL